MAAKAPNAFVAELWEIANGLFMPDHPWFRGIVDHRWTRDQIILGEIQHYLRVRTNPIFFGYIVTNVASERNYALMDVVMENFMEELGGEKTHVDIMLQFLTHAGISREDADRADPAPGTLAAIEMIRSGCQNRSALEGIALLAFVESMHGGPDGAAARVYKELIGHCFGSVARSLLYSGSSFERVRIRSSCVRRSASSRSNALETMPMVSSKPRLQLRRQPFIRSRT